MKDYGTKRVEMAWIAPFRKYAPVSLVVCVAFLLAVVLALPATGLSETVRRYLTVFLLVVVYAAFMAIAVFLFFTARKLERVQDSEMESSRVLYGLSERLDTTLRSLADGIISTDVDGVVTLMNDVAVQLTGWPMPRAVGSPASKVFRIVNELTHKFVQDPARMVLETGSRVREDANVVLVARNGTERPVAYNAAPILDEDGWMMGVVIVFHDVTDLRNMVRQREELIRELSETNRRLQDEIRKREAARRAALSLMQDTQMAQTALRESEERLRTLFAGIEDALFVHDASGRILDCNSAACTALGYPREELLARKVEDIEKAEEEVPGARWLVTKSGNLLPVHVHASAIRFHGEEATLLLAHDITELKRIQDELRASNEQLRESNAALEEYARVASHDLQEPLRKIESFAQVLVEDYGPRFDAPARNYLDIMVAAAARMRRLIRDVLAFSRAGSAEKPFTDVDLNRVLAVVQDNLSQRIEEKAGELVVEPLPTVQADETQMLQLLQNLVANGFKFNDKKRPVVEVSCTENNSEWTIRVKDNGIGMRPAEAQMIFAPFKRLHSQDQYEGTGIGLAICRRILARHGGRIGVESVPGKGSTFWLTLPKPQKQLVQMPSEHDTVSETKEGDAHERH